MAKRIDVELNDRAQAALERLMDRLGLPGDRVVNLVLVSMEDMVGKGYVRFEGGEATEG